MASRTVKQKTLREHFTSALLWLKSNVKATILSVLFGALVGFLVNYLVIVFVYDGNAKVPVLGPVPSLGDGKSNAYRSLCFALISLFGSALFGYWWQVGTRKFLAELKALPHTLSRFLTRDREALLGHILWGACLGLILSRVLAPWLTNILAFGFLLALPSIFGRFFCSLGVRLAATALRRCSPVRHFRLRGPLSAAVIFLGGAAALVLAHLLGTTVSRLGLALVFAVAAVLVQKKDVRIKGMSSFLLLWLCWEFQTEVLAHDGGYWEKPDNQSLWDWVRTTGLITASSSKGGAVIGGVVAPLGAGLGGSAGQAPSGWSGESDYDHEAWRRIDQLWTDASGEHFDRLVEMEARAAETGKIDLAELTRLERDFDRHVEQERREIDRRHEEFSRSQRDKTQDRLRAEREEEAQAREAENKRRDSLRRGRGLIDKVDDPIRAQQLEDFLDRQSDDPEKLERAVEALRQQVYEAEQERRRGEAEEAEGEADAYEESAQTAESIRDNSRRLNRLAARAVPGGEQIVAAQDALYGAVEGYAEDGVRGVVRGAVTNVIDDRTEGLGTAILETAEGNQSGETGRQRAGRLASNWWRNATQNKNPLELARRAREAESLGELFDVALDAADGADELRGGGDSNSAEASENHSHRSRRETQSAPSDASTPAPNTSDRRARVGVDGERRTRTGRDQQGSHETGEANTRDRSQEVRMRDEVANDGADTPPPRDPQTPVARDRTDLENDAQRAQDRILRPVDPLVHRESDGKLVREPLPDSEPNASQAANIAEFERQDAEARAREVAQEALDRDAAADEAAQQAQETRDALAQNQADLEQARRDVLDPEPKPGAVDRYEAAQAERNRLERELIQREREEQAAERESAAAAQRRAEAARELRRAQATENQAQENLRSAQGEFQERKEQLRDVRGADHELREAQGRLDDAIEAKRRARDAQREAESGTPGDRELADNAERNAQQELSDSQRRLDQARERMQDQLAHDADRRDDVDRMIRAGQQQQGVQLTPLDDPGEHRTLTPDEMRTRRAYDGRGPQDLPNFDGDNVRGDNDFDDQDRPVTRSTGSLGTDVHERIHALAHKNFRDIFPTTDSVRNFHEGITEFFTRQTLEQQLSPELGRRDNVYPQQRGVIEHLAQKVGSNSLSEAYFNGNTDTLYQKMGGVHNVHRLTILLNQEDYAGARAFIDGLP